MAQARRASRPRGPQCGEGSLRLTTMNVAFFLFALRAVDALTLKQAPEAAPVALPASETARSNSDEAAVRRRMNYPFKNIYLLSSNE